MKKKRQMEFDCFSQNFCVDMELTIKPKSVYFKNCIASDSILTSIITLHHCITYTTHTFDLPSIFHSKHHSRIHSAPQWKKSLRQYMKYNRSSKVLSPIITQSVFIRAVTHSFLCCKTLYKRAGILINVSRDFGVSMDWYIIDFLTHENTLACFEKLLL